MLQLSYLKMLEGLLLETDIVSQKIHYPAFTGYGKPYCVNQIHPQTLWCTFLYSAFPLSPEVQQGTRNASCDCFQLLKKRSFFYLLGGSERHPATWRAPLALEFKSLGCVCSFVCLSRPHGTARPSCSALMPVGDRLALKHNTEKDRCLLHLY